MLNKFGLNKTYFVLKSTVYSLNMSSLFLGNLDTFFFRYVLQKCPEDHLYVHEPPLVYDLNHDPFEAYPLSTENRDFKEAKEKAEELRKSHLASVEPVPQQLGI